MSGNPDRAEVFEIALAQYADQVEGDSEELRAGFAAMVEQNGMADTLIAIEENQKLIERMGW